MLARRRILYAVLPLGCLLLPGQAYAGRATEDPRQPPLKIVNYALRAQAIEPTKIGFVPGQAPEVLAARAEPVPAAPSRSEAPTATLQVADNTMEIMPWQRDCAAMGYPADYLGMVAGETVIDRAAGVRRDVWLSNNCMAPQADPVATAVAEAEVRREFSEDVEVSAARQPPEEPVAAVQAAAVHAHEAVLGPERTGVPALVTPRLSGTAVVEETVHQTAELHNTAALVTPRLENLTMNHDPAPGVAEYRPAPPIRAGMALAASAMPMPGWLDDELAELVFDPAEATPPDEALQRLETLGQKLAVNRLARLTVTAYASLTPERDARAARRLSLSRALAIRDALMLGGAGSEQVRLRALGANVPSGVPDRVDISEN